ncbi:MULTISPECIES: potassium channel family protein [Photobacterium]|uniref:Transporter n=1 Tax=Photobacterium ganghwense TaxID=320778 RepID=A0A0J1HAL6_9GAMM|nr:MULTISPECIES: potassium channel family protein [Photobacterium]KLV08690.1 transporter [Photobacterium ganghwense]MBV1839879.1 two pore domain potassium channel family protein [Photobacterium ganghwense]PSU10812.1 transporter [Photobacterium ganghwense]QSV12909.1 two pore domain potassium channel family protein [Photobacterium ganghwense]
MGRKITEQNNFYYMTLALIILLISTSLGMVIKQNWLDTIFQAITIFTFLVCLISLRFAVGWYRFLMTIMIIWVVLAISKNVFGITQVDIAMMLLMLMFFIGTFKAIVRQILFTGSIDNNKVVGSLALFLLLGLIWAILYLLILEFSPSSFDGLEYQDWGLNFTNVAYFSFVTLTTLGYGDISPVTPFAQVVVYLEAIAGVFYMAIVVASLVGASQSNQEKHDE